MASLDFITVHGFKSIRQLENFKLNPLNVVVGANGAGKSNFIELFRIISAMMREGGLKQYVGGTADAFFYGGPKKTSEIEIRLAFGYNGYDFDLKPTEDGFLLIHNEKRHFFPRNATRNFPSSSFDAQLPTERFTSDATRYTYDSITQWQIYHFHDTGKYAGMRGYCNVDNNEKLAEDACNIAPFLYCLKKNEPGAYESILNAIRMVIPFLDDFVLKPNENEQLRLGWRQKGLNDCPMRPSQFSDGAMRFICLATALMQPNLPSIIILDEPELGLHPEAIRILGGLITDASRKTQVIVATQSPLLLDQFAIADIIVARRQDGATSFERLQEKDYTAWLEEYSIGELWTKNVISGGTVHE